MLRGYIPDYLSMLTVRPYSTLVAERESGSQAKVGVASPRKAPKGHNAGEPRGFRAKHHTKGRQFDLRPLQSGSEGKDAPN